jgi:hypothetical protein
MRRIADTRRDLPRGGKVSDTGQQRGSAPAPQKASRVTRAEFEDALRRALADASEVASKIQNVFELPDDAGGPRFR